MARAATGTDGRAGVVEATTLAMIRRRFADRAEAVERMFGASESFRSLCRDYLACTAALARWQEASSEDARLRSGEYAELLNELTSEIEAQLQRAGGPTPAAEGKPRRKTTDSGR